MGASSPWVTVILAFMAAFGGAPLFRYLAERVKLNAKSVQTERAAIDKERKEIQRERAAMQEQRDRDVQSMRLEIRTYREALNDMQLKLGRLEGQTERDNVHIAELQAEIARLRGLTK